MDTENDSIEVLKQKIHSRVNIHPALFDLEMYR